MGRGHPDPWGGVPAAADARDGGLLTQPSAGGPIMAARRRNRAETQPPRPDAVGATGSHLWRYGVCFVWKYEDLRI